MAKKIKRKTSVSSLANMFGGLTKKAVKTSKSRAAKQRKMIDKFWYGSFYIPLGSDEESSYSH